MNLKFNLLNLLGLDIATKGNVLEESRELRGGVGDVAGEEGVVRGADGDGPAGEDSAVDGEDAAHRGVNVVSGLRAEIVDASNGDEPVSGGADVADHTGDVGVDHS